MTNKTVIALLAAGVIAAASVGTAAAHVLIQPGAASVIDLSAKTDKAKDENKGPQQKKNNPGLKNIIAQGSQPTGQVGAVKKSGGKKKQKSGNKSGQQQKQLGGSKSGGQKQKSGSQQQKQIGGSKSGGQKQKFGGQGGKSQKQLGDSKSGGQKQKFGGQGSQPPQQLGGSKGGHQQGGPGKYGSHKNVKIYKPKGGKNYNTVTAKKLHGLPPGSSRAYVHGRNYSAWRGRNGYRIRYHDRWRTFVPLSALAALLVGQRPFFPYAYISVPEYYCYGRTEDGCLLNWDEIETLEGDLIGQCVAYCPWEPY